MSSPILVNFGLGAAIYKYTSLYTNRTWEKFFLRRGSVGSRNWAPYSGDMRLACKRTYFLYCCLCCIYVCCIYLYFSFSTLRWIKLIIVKIKKCPFLFNGSSDDFRIPGSEHEWERSRARPVLDQCPNLQSSLEGRRRERSRSIGLYEMSFGSKITPLRNKVCGCETHALFVLYSVARRTGKSACT